MPEPSANSPSFRKIYTLLPRAAILVLGMGRAIAFRIYLRDGPGFRADYMEPAVAAFTFGIVLELRVIQAATQVLSNGEWVSRVGRR